MLSSCMIGVSNDGIAIRDIIQLSNVLIKNMTKTSSWLSYRHLDVTGILVLNDDRIVFAKHRILHYMFYNVILHIVRIGMDNALVVGRT